MKIELPVGAKTEVNNLFPVFLKLEGLSVLLVGAGNVALEKLSAIVSNSPHTRVVVVAPQISDGVRNLAGKYETIRLEARRYEHHDLDNADLVITAVSDPLLSAEIRSDAKGKGKLINAADKPDLCDFYLGSIVKKGNLKIAISTNGKSPTIAKRLREVFNEVVPDELDEVLGNMQAIRNRLNGDFADKVSRLNDITRELSLKHHPEGKRTKRKWKRIATYCVAAFGFMILGHLLLSLIPFSPLMNAVRMIRSQIESIFY